MFCYTVDDDMNAFSKLVVYGLVSTVLLIFVPNGFSENENENFENLIDINSLCQSFDNWDNIQDVLVCNYT